MASDQGYAATTAGTLVGGVIGGVGGAWYAATYLDTGAAKVPIGVFFCIPIGIAVGALLLSYLILRRLKYEAAGLTALLVCLITPALSLCACVGLAFPIMFFVAIVLVAPIVGYVARRGAILIIDDKVPEIL